MTLDRLDYARPAVAEEAVRLLGTVPGSRALAGGQRLVGRMSRRPVRPALVVDLAGIAELRGVSGTANGLRFGAMTTFVELAEHRATADLPAVRDAVAATADPHVRHRATLGAAVAAGPSAHLPAALLVHDATVEIADRSRRRRLSLVDLRAGLASGELLVSVDVTVSPGSTSAYLSVDDRATTDPVSGVAALVGPVPANGPAPVRIGVTGAVTCPLLLRTDERLLAEDPLAVLDAAVAAHDASFVTSASGTAEYRRRVTAVLLERAVAAARSRIPAGGNTPWKERT